MKNFDREKRFSSKGGFDKRGKRDFGSRNQGRPQMHRATCSECGRPCEVPFRPTGEKPVYCSDCFNTMNGGSRKPERRSFDRPNQSFEKRMFTAVCSQCGQHCEVPFRPTGEKPVYCDACFSKDGNAPAKKNPSVSASAISKEQFESLNAKLDKIMKALNIENKISSEEKPAKVAKVETKKETAPEKEKKATAKAPAKTAAKPAKAKKVAAKPAAKKVAKKKK